MEACRKGVLSVVEFLSHKHLRVNHPEECRGCEKCAAACPNGAMVLRKRAHEERRSSSLQDIANV